MILGIIFIGAVFIPCETRYYIDFTALYGMFFFFYFISALNHEYLHAYAHHINGGFEGNINIKMFKSYCLNKKEHSYTYKQMRRVLMLPLYVNISIGIVIAAVNISLNYLICINRGLLEQWEPVHTMLLSFIPMVFLITCSIGDFILLREAWKVNKEYPYLEEIGIVVKGKDVPHFKINGKSKLD